MIPEVPRDSFNEVRCAFADAAVQDDCFHILKLTTRTLTSEEVAQFDEEPLDLNWGVLEAGRPVACFRAEVDGEGGLWVHADVKRHTLTPFETKAFAQGFCDKLLQYGHKQLRTQIPQDNRAALRLARAARFREVERIENDVVLKYGQ